MVPKGKVPYKGAEPTGTPGGPPMVPAPKERYDRVATRKEMREFEKKWGKTIRLLPSRLPVLKSGIPLDPSKAEDCSWYRVPGSFNFYQGWELKVILERTPELYGKLREGIDAFKKEVMENYTEMPWGGHLRTWIKNTDIKKLAKDNPKFLDELLEKGIISYGEERLSCRMRGESMAGMPELHYITSANLPWTFDPKTGIMSFSPGSPIPRARASLLSHEAVKVGRVVRFQTQDGPVSFRAIKPTRQRMPGTSRLKSVKRSRRGSPARTIHF